MGEIAVKSGRSLTERNAFVHHLLKDVQALERMLEANCFEKGTQRIGAEQEISLFNGNYEPSFLGPEILETIPDEHFTTEIGRFNLEINLDPQEVDPYCLHRVEHQLFHLLRKGHQAAASFDSRILLTGILPTIRYSHLQNDAMTPRDRYYSLSEVVRFMRGSDFEIRLLGVDELIASLPSVIFEACNTSFQLHLQIEPKDFVRQYNWSQLIAAPVLAASANSPLLFGRELWAETRISLFHQSVDTRTSSNHFRQKQPRVFFGNGWLRDSVAEIFKDNIARFPITLMKLVEEDSLQKLEAGEVPALTALRVFNGSTYPWNRPCYGITNGLPHLRIECRYIPAGPTILDEMANFAFWIGLMQGMPEYYYGFEHKMSFRVAKGNFYCAARTGLDTSMEWFGRIISVSELIIRELLPIAHEGLAKIGLSSKDAARYLNIIERRILLHQNGARWQVRNFRRLREKYGQDAALSRLTAAMYQRQESYEPVHTWSDVNGEAFTLVQTEQESVGKIMTTDLFTVTEDEPAQLVKMLMEWKKIRHLPIENIAGELVGLVTATNLKAIPECNGTLVSEIMVKELFTATPDMPVTEAAKIIKTKNIGCLPIVENGMMVGLVTDTDLKRLELL